MNTEQKAELRRILAAAILFLIAWLIPISEKFRFLLCLVSYLIVGWDILKESAENIAHGEVFDENFLMSVASIGAFCLGEYTEAAAVMLLYSIGEFFEDYAIDRSRDSITEMMDLRPDHVNIRINGELAARDPAEIGIGETIVIKPGERIPLDGIIVSGSSQIDNAALTGESLPVNVSIGDEICSGGVNLNGLLEVRTTKTFGDSTVSRILELVENAQEKKSKSEAFITRFARIYTPAVVTAALLLAVIPPVFFGASFRLWITRALTFLVVSCPCALVISIPLTFFAGIGCGSKNGILIKGSSYLETLANAGTFVFDKTGTLTQGTFTVIAVHPEQYSEEKLLEFAAHAESFSSHPIALSIRTAYGRETSADRVSDLQEISGHGISAVIDSHNALVGNDRLMALYGIPEHECELTGTIIHIAVDGEYSGHIVISDVIKPDAKEAIKKLKENGVSQIIMLTGDKESVAEDVATKLSLDGYYAELLPQDKLSRVEELLSGKDVPLVFVGDGINDAPSLMRADVGVAMGALGSDAAIESADIVLMYDSPSQIVKAIRISRKTLAIVKQNIIFAIAVKLLVLVLAAFGQTGMWAAVFADVGVCFIAILNALRALRIAD